MNLRTFDKLCSMFKGMNAAEKEKRVKRILRRYHEKKRNALRGN